MANASLEDCQLFAQSDILQRELFIAAKDQEDHPKKREDCVQHEAESVSASSLKINRFRNRWNSGEAQLIGVMVYSFARVSATIHMRVEDYFQNGKRWWFRLHEKGGKRHEVPSHHNAEVYVDAYLNSADISGEKKTPL